jgi:lipopolysaccharide export system protein LptA
MKSIVEGLLLLALAAAAGGVAWAETADRSRPIHIEADAVRLDDARKIAVYEGGVVLSQGTLHITADRIDVRQDDQGMVSGEAAGQPVTFRQKLEGRDEYLEGQARRLEYDARAEVMKLIGSAYLKQGGDELRGGAIVYDLRTERYQAQGAADAVTPGRVRAVIRPRAQPGGTADGTPARP